MTYLSLETSVESGQPVEVYEFLAGSAQFFYTSAKGSVVVGVTTYEPRVISRENLKEDPSKRDFDFIVRLPTSDEVSQRFLGVLPGIRMRLRVKRFHRTDTPTPQVVTIFDGYVNTVKFERNGKQAVFVSRSVIASNGRTIPRRRYAAHCGHVLYDPLTCKVDSTSATFRAANRTVSSQVGRILTVSGISPAYADGWFTGGFVEALGINDFRLILDHTGSVLTLLVPFSQQPTLVNVFAGCDHDPVTCSGKFGNFEHYGGFPFVPIKNPFQSPIV